MMKLAEKVKGVLCTVKNRVYYPVAVGAMSVGMSLTALAAEGDAVSTTNVAENLATSFQTMFEIPGNGTAVDYNIQPISSVSTSDVKKKERGNKNDEPKNNYIPIFKDDEKPTFRDEERAS